MVPGFAALLLAIGMIGTARPTVAITYFDNTSADPQLEPLRKGLADMLITDLSVVSSLRIVEREKLNAILGELALSKSPFIDRASAQRLGKGLSAEYLMTGSYLLLDDKMRIDTKVLRVDSGEIVAGESVEGTREEFFALEKELAEILTRALPIKLAISEKSALRKSQTESFNAFQQYSRGLQASDDGDDRRAREAFQKALDADPNYRAATAALGRLRTDIAAHEQARAETFEGELAQLDPSDPELGKKAKRLYESGGKDSGTYLERELRQRKMLEHLASKGLRPYEPITYERQIGSSKKRYLEVQELLQLVGAWGDDAEVLDATPLVLEYLVKKYPDDPEMFAQIRHHTANLERSLARRAASPEKFKPQRRIDDQKLRADATHAVLLAIARRYEKTIAAKDRSPDATVARLKKVVAAEEKRQVAEFDREFARRLDALDPREERSFNESWGNLVYQAEQADAGAKRLRFKVLLLGRTFEKGWRPFSGTKEDPFWQEESQLLMLMNRYTDDPQSLPLISPVGRYLLQKYPKAKYLGSQLGLTSKSVEAKLAELDRTRRQWEEKKGSPEYEAAPEVRALFRRIIATVE